jgi:hypothetical protein
MALDLNAVMDAIGTRLSTITGLRVADYAAQQVNPPQAIVSLPTEPVEYDAVMGRGADRAVIPITVLVGAVSDRASRDAIAAYISGTGALSVKVAVEGGNSDLGAAAQTVRVMTARVDIVTIGAVDYLGATFDVEVFD